MVHCDTRKVFQMRSILIKVLPGIFLITELSIVAKGYIHVALANGTKLATVWKTRSVSNVIFGNWEII